MKEEHQKFVKTMLEKAQQKEAVKPQTRFEGIDKEEIEQMTKAAMEKLQKAKTKKD